MNTEFRKRMGLEQVDEAETRKRFLNRVGVSILRWLQDNKGRTFYDQNFIWWISEQLGEPWGDRVEKRELGAGYWSDVTMENMCRGDFFQTLLVIEKSYQYLNEDKPGYFHDRYGFNKQEELINLHNFNERMNRIMILSEIDLGVFWKDGKFYLSGAKELDDALIFDPLEWLSSYPETQKQFAIALDHYKKSIKNIPAGKDAITNSYTSVEALTKEILKNNNSFEKNSDSLMEKLNLPKEYKNIVHYYKQLAHEYSSRHAGSNPSHKEVEAFVYLTGLLLRLVTNS